VGSATTALCTRVGVFSSDGFAGCSGSGSGTTGTEEGAASSEGSASFSPGGPSSFFSSVEDSSFLKCRYSLLSNVLNISCTKPFVSKNKKMY